MAEPAQTRRLGWREWAVLAATLMLLLTVNVTIYQRERLLSDGRVVLLELAPVDPRSLMQGDYMALRYRLEIDAFQGRDLKRLGDGLLVADTDQRGVARFKHFADAAPLHEGEFVLRYRIRNARVKFATNAYFFEEGSARRYERARFGEFRVAPNGEMILTGLRGEDQRKL